MLITAILSAAMFPYRWIVEPEFQDKKVKRAIHSKAGSVKVKASDQDAIRELDRLIPEEQLKALRIQLKDVEQRFDFEAGLSLSADFQDRYPQLAGIFALHRVKYLVMLARYQEADALFTRLETLDESLQTLKDFVSCKAGHYGTANIEANKSVVLALFPPEWEMASYWPSSTDEAATTFKCALAASTSVEDYLKLRLLRVAENIYPENPILCYLLKNELSDPQKRLEVVQRGLAGARGGLKTEFQVNERQCRQEIARKK